ncbi:MAG: hypothetical protein AB7P17_01855 [Nitrospirales bacterium]|nr:hypothetical protein [Nitrospirales bacterium]
MFVSGVETEQHAQVLQPLTSNNRPISAIQKTDKDDEDQRKVQATSSAVQDRVTLSKEAQTLADHIRQNQKPGTSTLQDSRTPFDR